MPVDLLHDIPPGPDAPNVVHAVIEIPKGSRNKYEYSKTYGAMKLDRVLYSSIHYPGDYGFIPQTHFDDGDPMDIIVMINEPTFPGCLMEARPVGMLKIIDRGELDYKILSVAATDPTYSAYVKLADVPPHYLVEVEHFFTTYKQLEGAIIDDLGWVDVDDARQAVLGAIKGYNDLMAKTPDPGK